MQISAGSGRQRGSFGGVIAQVVDAPLSVAEHEDAVADKAAGAVVSFAGVAARAENCDLIVLV